MKRIFVIMTAVIGLGFSAKAQTVQCTIKNGNGATFTASVDSHSYSDGKEYITVTASNDADPNIGSVTGIVTISYYGSDPQTKTFTVQAGSELSKTYVFETMFSCNSKGCIGISLSCSKCE